MLRREGRNSLVCEFSARHTDRISDGEDTRVKYTDDIAGVCFINNMTVTRHHLLRLGKTHFLSSLHMEDFHSGIEFAGADAHECDTVTVCFVHVCLDFKDKRREILFDRIDHAAVCRTRKRRHRHREEVLQKSLHTKVGERRSEEYRGELSLADKLLVKLCTCAVEQLDLIHKLFFLVLIDHIEKIVRPISAGPAAKNVIFLSADAFGVLPPVSVLTPEQTQYYFLSGFTAKLAGTERGITEPTPTFSACFGQAFLELHPTKYAEELVKKMEKSGAKAYLVNTGWNGTGKRISIKDTRGIIDAILNGDIKTAPTKTIPYFNFEVPTELPGVDPAILDPRDTYADASEWEVKAKDLAARFVKNFAKYEGNEAGKALVAAGPQA